MSSEKFCLRWNDFESNISCAFRELREDKDFFDVTLACDEEQVQVHKVILSACSNFFKSLLRRNPHNHPLLYLKGVKYNDLLCVLNFMYHGEVNVAQEDLNSFLAVAEDLQVKGLTQGQSNTGSKDSQARSDPKPLSRPRPPPQSVPVKKARPVTPQVVQPVNDDVQEVAAPMVKVEPVHSQEQGAGDQHQQQGQYHEGALQQLDEQGEYDESGYEDYSGYDGGSGYGGNMMDVTATDKGGWNDGLKEQESSAMLEMLSKEAQGYSCNICGKHSGDLTKAKAHMEAKHFPSSTGYTCQCCNRWFKTKNALCIHMSREHRDRL